MTATSAGRTDLPTVDDDSRVYWDGYRDNRFLIARCAACTRVHHYPRPQCPFCWSEDVAPWQASGDATLYTYSVVHMNDLVPFRDQLPYVAAVVELAEGPRVMTQVVGCPQEQLSIGMRLAVVFEALTDEITVPVFRPAG